jgi:hypothetical protein
MDDSAAPGGAAAALNTADEQGREEEMRTWRVSPAVRRHGRWRRSFALPLLPLFAVVLSCAPRVNGLKQREVAEARLVFEANLAAIRARDLEGYLATYLDSPDFVYLGPEGLSRGFAPFAAARRAAADFPDSLVAGPAEFTWIAPGVVHVAYPFAAVQGDVTGAGWSERVLVRTRTGWRISVTTVVPGYGRVMTDGDGQ